MIDTALTVLGCYRVAHMIAYEDGPGFVFEHMRARVMPIDWLYAGLSCPLCLSFWIAPVLPYAPRWVRSWLGIAGAVLIIHRVLEGSE